MGRFVTGGLTDGGKRGKLPLVFLFFTKGSGNVQNQCSPYGYREGLKDGMPIGLGYLSVSFGFGIMAVAAGLYSLEAVLISMLNLTSAGQVAGVKVLEKAVQLGAVTGAGLIQMALCQLVINLRYALMGVALTQRLDPYMTTGKRLLYSFFITDEIFAVSSSKPHAVGPRYFSGLATAPCIGWTMGTLLGAVAGNILPESMTQALALALYAMFIAIILPPMKTEKGVLPCVVLAAGLSCLLTFLPCFSFLKDYDGFIIIISAILAAVVLALVRPIHEEAEA